MKFKFKFLDRRRKKRQNALYSLENACVELVYLYDVSFNVKGLANGNWKLSKICIKAESTNVEWLFHWRVGHYYSLLPHLSI